MLKTYLPSLPCPIFATSAANIITCKLNTLYYPKEVFCKIDRHRAFTLASCWCCTHSDCPCPVPALQEWKCLKAFVWLVGVNPENHTKEKDASFWMRHFQLAQSSAIHRYPSQWERICSGITATSAQPSLIKAATPICPRSSAAASDGWKRPGRPGAVLGQIPAHNHLIYYPLFFKSWYFCRIG